MLLLRRIGDDIDLRGWDQRPQETSFGFLAHWAWEIMVPGEPGGRGRNGVLIPLQFPDNHPTNRGGSAQHVEVVHNLHLASEP